MPQFYEEYLKEKLGGEPIELNNAFRTMTEGIDHPQLVLLLKQVQSYSGFGPSAKLFYEGKVLEAVVFILDEVLKSNNRKRKFHMSSEDEANINAAVQYTYNHFALGITLDQLSKIALMGTTKLKTAFKE